jgi:methyl-accepting chemotaxis protein WspA
MPTFDRVMRRATIGRRLVIWFLLISLIPCAGLAWILYSISSKFLEKTVEQKLLVMAGDKAQQLEDYATERIRSVAALAHTQTIIGATSNYQNAINLGGVQSQAYNDADAVYRPFMISFAETYGYPDLLLLSPEGQVLFALNNRLAQPGSNLATGPLKDTELAGVFDRDKTLLQPELSDFQNYPGLAEPAAFVASPVLKDGLVAGVLVFQLDNRAIYQIFNDYAGLGETGENLAGALVGEDQIEWISRLRHDPDLNSQRRILMGSQDSLAMQQAVMGGRDVGRFVDYRNVPNLAAWLYVPSFRWGLVVKQDAQEALALVYKQRRTTMFLLALLIVPVTGIALVVARSIARPLELAAKVSEQVAAGDLTPQFEIGRNDETGLLLKAIRTMIQNLNKLLSQVKQSSIQLISTATQIGAAAKQQENTVQNFGASTNEIAAAVKEISATSRELLGTMEDVKKVATETSTVADAGRSSLGGMEAAMKHLSQATGSISSKLAVINEKANNIGSVITTITKVADQTNLLSLNAAIEAEKAGEYGLGFGVVAREIRRLADQTAVATLDIEQMVKEMQGSVSAGVMEMEKFAEEVRRGVEETGRISGQFGKIIGQVGQLTPRFEAVHEGMQSQSQGAGQISQAMGQLTESARQSAASLQEFQQAAAQLQDAVRMLREEVSHFKVN